MVLAKTFLPSYVLWCPRVVLAPYGLGGSSWPPPLGSWPLKQSNNKRLSGSVFWPLGVGCLGPSLPCGGGLLLASAFGLLAPIVSLFSLSSLSFSPWLRLSLGSLLALSWLSCLPLLSLLSPFSLLGSGSWLWLSLGSLPFKKKETGTALRKHPPFPTNINKPHKQPTQPSTKGGQGKRYHCVCVCAWGCWGVVGGIVEKGDN